MHHRARMSQTPMIAVGNYNSKLAESSSMIHHRSVYAATVCAIDDGRGCQGQCTIKLKNATMSAVGGCNSELMESLTMAYHRGVCVTSFGVIKDGRGHGAERRVCAKS